jgi:hypothetical protein
LPEEAAWERAQALAALMSCLAETGRFDEAEALTAPLDLALRRTGNPGAEFALGLIVPAVDLARTGDWQGFRAAIEPRLARPVFTTFFRLCFAAAELQLGDEEHALAQLARAVDEQQVDSHLHGLPQAVLFAATALAGRLERARALLPAAEAALPVPGRRNAVGRFYSLLAHVEGLALLGETERSARLYPLARWGIDTGSRGPWANTIVNPQLAAAIAADAGGMAEAADEHFAAAAREAREVPFRPRQPAALYWHGRSIAARTGTGDRERGRAMVAAALEDFRTLRMVPYARLAEQFLVE